MTSPRNPPEASDGRHGPNASPADPRLEELRRRISEVDGEIIRLIGERRALVLAVGDVKRELGLPVLDPAREARVVRSVAERARGEGVDQEMVRDVIWRIIASAREAQEGGRATTGWPDVPPPPGPSTD